MTEINGVHNISGILGMIKGYLTFKLHSYVISLFKLILMQYNTIKYDESNMVKNPIMVFVTVLWVVYITL